MVWYASQFIEHRALSNFLHTLRWCVDGDTLLILKTKNLWQTEFVVACMPRLLVTLLTFHTANANASSACTKSLAIYYSDSFTNSCQRRVEKFPYAVIRADERRRTPNGNKINALHLVSFDVNVDFLCEERKWRPANTYKLIRKLVPLEMNRRQKRT